MKFEMQKAKLLAENIHGFIKFVNKSYKNKSSIFPVPDKLYQVILLIKEYRFQSIADELKRVNSHSCECVYTHLLVDRFIKGINVIGEYAEKNYDDLFILTARVHTLKNLSSSFSKKRHDPEKF